MMFNTTTLETLIDTTYDSVDGYRKAAEKADSPDLREILLQRAERRQQTLDRLNEELVRQGRSLVTQGTATGALHRLWLTITDLFESGDKAAINRVEEGEDYLAEKFEAALAMDNLDPQGRTVINSALAEVREGERLADALERQFG
ncbi:MAG: PA2169 family four-helix-bundle protein [Alteraurantiacibacter sp.]